VIPDSHNPLIGLRPVLFSILGFQVTSYAFFMLLGVAAAIGWYVYESRKTGPANPHSWTIILSALFFGSLGAKLMAVALNAGHYSSFGLMQFLYSGRSILGGLIGGWIGVRLVKWWFGITTRHGNAIAPAAALGIAIGRLGCLLGSCCYGKPTTLPWAVDFGDGVSRHPTQVYETVFAVALFVYFSKENRKNPAPGILFKRFLVAYFGFRFLVEFIRIEPQCCLGLSVFQVVSLLVVTAMLARSEWLRTLLSQGLYQTRESTTTVPEGHCENSPTFQRWDRRQKANKSRRDG
jgi:prolipoprotein diacylglyceryltransferase